MKRGSWAARCGNPQRARGETVDLAGLSRRCRAAHKARALGVRSRACAGDTHSVPRARRRRQLGVAEMFVVCRPGMGVEAFRAAHRRHGLMACGACVVWELHITLPLRLEALHSALRLKAVWLLRDAMLGGCHGC